MTDELMARLLEFAKDARALLEHAEEAIEHATRADLKATADIVAVSHYKLDQVSTDRKDILEYLGDKGVTPGG
jgi:hypothetical protein